MTWLGIDRGSATIEREQMTRAACSAQLSFVMPTYNRAEYLDCSLKVHVPILSKHRIKLAVFDNASTDNTRAVVEKWQQVYPLIEYHRADSNGGPDKNIGCALASSDTLYTWLLGDTYRIPEEGVAHVLELCQGGVEYAAIVFNVASIVQAGRVPSADYVDHDKLLGDLGAHMASLSSLVFGRQVLRVANFGRFEDTNFIQTGVIFEALPSCPGVVHWVQPISVESLQCDGLAKKGWYAGAAIFEIACKRWTAFVLSLPPAYGLESKLRCLMDFGAASGILRFRSLVNLRRRGILDLRAYSKYRRYFSFTVRTPRVVIVLLCLSPRTLIKAIALVVALWRGRRERFKSILSDEA